jgi:hypothetical protein
VSSHPTPYPLSLPHLADERLTAIAHALAEAAEAEPAPADLVGLVDLRSIGIEPAAGAPPDHIVLTAVADPDPVAGLLGTVAPPEVWAVGLVADARARFLDDGTPVGATSFVHLLDRRGSSVTVLRGPGHDPLVTGPGTDLGEGRIADLCRRMLGLPTPPPPTDMTAHVVDLWLARATRAALQEPGLEWAEVVARNPATELAVLTTATPTPAAVARRTRELGEQLDWERYRTRCIEAGGTPFGELDGEVLSWMDAGMFARWMLGETLSWSAHLDLLEGLVSPGAAERLRLTVERCPAPPWPPR